MFFSDMEELIRKQAEDPQYTIENKQRINLSAHARYVIRHDGFVFLKSTPEEQLISRIINEIFAAYADCADASIWHRIAARDTEYRAVLTDGPASARCREELLTAYEKELIKKVNYQLSKKGTPLSFRFNKQNLERLAFKSFQQEGAYYQDRIGKYVKAVVEEYSEKPYVQRELIYCREIVKEFQRARQDKKLLKIRLASRNSITGLNNIKYMKPYGIYQDGEVLYNYLVGYTSEESNGIFTIASIRLSSIISCSSSSAGAFLSKEEGRRIEDRILDKGVQFLPDDSEEQEIKVLLTEEGKKMYSRIFHLRPMYITTQQDKPNVYVFHCTIRQAENYFFNFGHNAQILSPICLQEKLKQKYEDAAQKYKNIN